jgi:hypothetical protein
MECFTFFHCQLQRGLQVTKFAPPPGGTIVKGCDKEVLFLGQYGKKNNHGPSDIARNVNLDKDHPAIVDEMLESERIIFNPFNRNEPSFSSKSCRIINRAFPRKIYRTRDDGTETFFIVLAKPLALTNNVVIRVNTCSADDSTNRRGGWNTIYGRPSLASHARGVREQRNGFIDTAWTDDLIIMHNEDVIKIVTEGSDEIDDQVVINMNGHLIMAPAGSFYMSGIQQKPADAETIEKNMASALSEQDFVPEMSVQA